MDEETDEKEGGINENKHNRGGLHCHEPITGKVEYDCNTLLESGEDKIFGLYKVEIDNSGNIIPADLTKIDIVFPIGYNYEKETQDGAKMRSVDIMVVSYVTKENATSADVKTIYFACNPVVE